MLQIVLIFLLLAAAMLLLSVRVLLKKNGRFSHQHISQSPLMRQKGIHCATSQDREARRSTKSTDTKRIDVKQL